MTYYTEKRWLYGKILKIARQDHTCLAIDLGQTHEEKKTPNREVGGSVDKKG